MKNLTLILSICFIVASCNFNNKTPCYRFNEENSLLLNACDGRVWTLVYQDGKFVPLKFIRGGYNLKLGEASTPWPVADREQDDKEVAVKKTEEIKSYSSK